MRPGPSASALDEYLADAIRREVTPGAVALVAEGEQVLYLSVQGHAQVKPCREPMLLDTLFDVASLTKPLVTAALALILEADLGLGPDRAARSLLPELETLDHAEITLRHLLAHSAGLPAWRPLFLRAETPAGFLRVLRDEPLSARPGQQVLYSDPGYMAAGEMVARAAGTGLDALFREVLAGPLGLRATFNPAPELASRCAATEDGQAYEREMAGKDGRDHGGWRSGVLRGQVHDHHAWVAGGVLGSAGLFADVSDLHRLALELLGEGRGLLPARALERLRSPWGPEEGEARSEGFALNRGGEGSCGAALSEGAFGHTGFTGTSLWVDPEPRRIYLLLTNRVHPRVRPGEMPEFRRGFHRLAAEL